MDKIEKFVRSKLPDFFVEQHVKHVVKEARWLCKFYPDADKEVVKAGAWLHDVEHPQAGYKGDDHNIASSKTANKFLKSINFDQKRLKEVLHCIETHITSRPPEPETIEAKIVDSADNLTHFTMFDFLLKRKGTEWILRKLKRDLESRFMLPEALKKAKRLAIGLEKKHKIKIINS